MDEPLTSNNTPEPTDTPCNSALPGNSTTQEADGTPALCPAPA